MRKALVILSAVLLLTTLVLAAPALAKGAKGVAIQDGVLKYAPGHYFAGQPLVVGFDPYGYNYQAHMFSGSYANVYLGAAGFPPYDPANEAAYLAANPKVVKHWAWPYRSTTLIMKWNDAWIANTDRDGDGKLDRHYGFATYIGSGAWETNHMSDSYIGDDGLKHNWVDFVKIVAAPADATKSAGVWYTADGSEIGPVIWTEFATIFEVYNDPYGGYHGNLYHSPTSSGFGYYGPQGN